MIKRLLRPLVSVGGVLLLVSVALAVAAINWFGIARGFAHGFALREAIEAQSAAHAYALGAVMFLVASVGLFARHRGQDLGDDPGGTQ